jgi:hypothetical protein
LIAIRAKTGDDSRTQASREIYPSEQRSAASAAKGAQMDDEKGQKRTALE